MPAVLPGRVSFGIPVPFGKWLERDYLGQGNTEGLAGVYKVKMLVQNRKLRCPHMYSLDVVNRMPSECTGAESTRPWRYGALRLVIGLHTLGTFFPPFLKK